MIEKNIILEAWALRQQAPKVLLVEGESQSRVLSLQLLSNGQPIDLTGTTVTFYYQTPEPDNKEIFLPATITDAKKGCVDVTMTRLSTATPGSVFDAEVRVTLSNGGNLRILGPTLFIAEGASDDKIEASDEFAALDKALAEVEGFVNGYVPKTGLPYNDPMTGPLYIDNQGENYVGRMGVYHGTSQDFFNMALVTRGTNTAVSQFNIYPDGTATISDKTIYNTGNTNQTLWSGSWNNGNITVPDFSKFQIFSLAFSGKGTRVLAMKHGEYLRGIGGYSTGSNILLLGMAATFSGNTLSFVAASEYSLTAGTNTAATVTAIVGVL